MKITAFILILLLHGISLFAFADRGILSEFTVSEYNHQTNRSAELTASWERDSDAKLMGERVLFDLKSNRGQSLPVNAFCSTESMEKLIAVRKLAADIISSVNASGISSDNSFTHNSRGNSESIVAAEILTRTGKISITSLTHREQKLVNSAENINLSCDIFFDKGLKAENIPVPEYAASAPGITLPAPPLFKLKLRRKKKNASVYNPKSIQCRKNLYDNEFADLYKLFLYVRDNSANGKSFFLTYNSFPFGTIQPLCNLTRYKNTSTTNNEIIQPGAPS